MTADFTISIGATPTQFIVNDASTAGYGGETITQRQILIEDSTGVVTTVPFPLVTGVGDRLTYDLGSAKAVTIQILLTPSSVNTSSVYNKTYSYVTMGVFDPFLKKLEDTTILNVDPKTVLASSTSLIREFEWAQALYDACIDYSSVAELASAQKCIDSLTELSKSR